MRIFFSRFKSGLLSFRCTQSRILAIPQSLARPALPGAVNHEVAIYSHLILTCVIATKKMSQCYSKDCYRGGIGIGRAAAGGRDFAGDAPEPSRQIRAFSPCYWMAGRIFDLGFDFRADNWHVVPSFYL